MQHLSPVETLRLFQPSPRLWHAESCSSLVSQQNMEEPAASTSHELGGRGGRGAASYSSPHGCSDRSDESIDRSHAALWASQLTQRAREGGRQEGGREKERTGLSPLKLLSAIEAEISAEARSRARQRKVSQEEAIDRLNQDAARRQEKGKERYGMGGVARPSSAPSSPHTPSHRTSDPFPCPPLSKGSGAVERLYEMRVSAREERRRMVEEGQAVREAKELEECTFEPSINHLSRQLQRAMTSALLSPRLLALPLTSQGGRGRGQVKRELTCELRKVRGEEEVVRVDG